jgi:hypothetical protein
VGDRSIFDSLYLSYDALEEQHKEMFLDVDCALEDINGQSQILVEAKRWYVEFGAWNLMAKSLINVDGKGCVLRDMGRVVVKVK